MNKHVAIVIDKSGSMDLRTGYNGAAGLLKVEEARNAAIWLVNALYNHITDAGTNPAGDSYKVAIWRFANEPELVTTIVLDPATSPGSLNAATDAITNAIASGMDVALGGVMTNIFKAVHEAADDIIDNPHPGGSKRLIVLFTDGNQTIAHGGSLGRGGYEAAVGQTFDAILDSRNIILNAVSIGSDAAFATLTDLAAQGETGSNAFDVDEATSTTETAIMDLGVEALLDNGLLPFALDGASFEPVRSARLSLPRRGKGSDQSANEQAFHFFVDGLPRELVLGLTWQRTAEPSIEVVSPSGVVYRPGSPDSRVVRLGSLLSLHVLKPEPGTWKGIVTGDKRLPLNMNLMVRGINPAFKLLARVMPFAQSAPGISTLSVQALWNGTPALGSFHATATIPGSPPIILTQGQAGDLSASIPVTKTTEIGIAFEGKLEGIGEVRRFTTAHAIVGNASDPVLLVSPARYGRGATYAVSVEILGENFTPQTIFQFGSGIAVTGVTLLGPSHAQVILEIANNASTGPRVVGTLKPAAETVTLVEVLARDENACKEGERICCLRFDARGHLVGLVLESGRKIAIPEHKSRLLEILRDAHERGAKVNVHLDARGGLAGVDICR